MIFPLVQFYLGIGIINLFGDICILAVPVQRVLRLHLGLSQKIAVCFMFLLGSFVCFASLYRIVTIVRLTQSKDISWAKSDVFIWSSVEPSVGIISGCLPTLRPLMLHVMRRVGIEPSSVGGPTSKDTPWAGSNVNPLETISKKRTRKMKHRDILDETQFTALGDEEEGGGGAGPFGKNLELPAASRSEDELSLTRVETLNTTGRGPHSDWKSNDSGRT
jgi:hypothetical protein